MSHICKVNPWLILRLRGSTTLFFFIQATRVNDIYYTGYQGQRSHMTSICGYRSRSLWYMKCEVLLSWWGVISVSSWRHSERSQYDLIWPQFAATDLGHCDTWNVRYLLSHRDLNMSWWCVILVSSWRHCERPQFYLIWPQFAATDLWHCDTWNVRSLLSHCDLNIDTLWR